MEMNSASFRLGAFVLAGAIAIIALIIFLSGGIFQGGKTYETYFTQSVQGLGVGTDVKYRGVQVGKISSIGLVITTYPASVAKLENDPQYRQVVVRFDLDMNKIGKKVNIAQAVEAGLRAQIKPQGITGLSYLDLSFVDPSQNPAPVLPWKPEDPVIPSIPSALAQVQDAAVKVFASLSKVDVGELSNNLNALLATLNQQLNNGQAHAAIDNAATLLATLNETIKQSDLPQTTASIRTLTSGQQTQQILSQLNQTTAQLAKASAALPALVTSSQQAILRADETTADIQTQLAPILQSMRATMDNLRDLSASLAANPGQALRGEAPPPPQGN